MILLIVSCEPTKAGPFGQTVQQADDRYDQTQGIPKSWGYPHSWMVFVRENPNLNWMMAGGSPMT